MGMWIMFAVIGGHGHGTPQEDQDHEGMESPSRTDDDLSESKASKDPAEGLMSPTSRLSQCLIVDFDITAPPEGFEDDFFDLPSGARMADLKLQLSKPTSALWMRIKDRLERTIGADAMKTYEVAEAAKPVPKTKHRKDFSIQDELNLREAPKDTGNAYFMKGFSSQTAPFQGVRPNLLPVISQDKVTIDKAMLPALYQPFRTEREHPYGLEDPSVLLPRGALKQPPPDEGRIFRLVTQEVPEPRATVVHRHFGRQAPTPTSPS
ncbi:Uncharacterized protein SCF082_LOCUS35175 [Durusdinium trenchii]|uniref:Uncharacterized protein n=1 Tax=Durusdinium trenchii TaxID=1381693 RepID=A0ABP0P4F2_9DINO